MSQKRKNQRANHSVKEQKKGEKVVMWIGIALLALAAAFMIYSVTL